MELDEDTIELLEKIFFPTLHSSKTSARQENRRFVHYCSAEAAFQIISNKEFWMRESSVMNDYSEIRHGRELLESSDARPVLVKALNDVYEGVKKEIDGFLGNALGHMDAGTFISCFSEHHDEEDMIGRLSMWRAYGGNSGVALVLNNQPFLNSSADIELFASPVAYLDQDEFDLKIREIAQNISKNTKVLQSLDRERFSLIVMNVLMFAIMCTKHKGFAEEKEWRVITVPSMHNNQGFLRSGVHTIGGIPQTVYKIPLEDREDLGLEGIAIPKLIDRIIIGPTKHPYVMWEAFVKKLDEVGFENPRDRVVVSSLPLRSH